MSEPLDAGATTEMPSASVTDADASGRTGRTDHMQQDEIDAAMEAIPGSQQLPLFYALRFRNYKLYFYGQLISVAGTWMQDVAQKWLVWELTKSSTWVGIVSAANAIPYVLFAIWGGHIADRHSRRLILIWTQAAAMVLAFVLALLATKSISPIPLQAWHIVLISGLSGIVNAFNMPAQQAFVTDLVEERGALGNAIALNSLRFNLARILGPMLAGIVLVKFGTSACFALNGVSFLAVIASLAMLRLPAFVRQARTGTVFDGFLYIARTPSVLRIILLIAAGSILTWPLSTLFPEFAALFHVGERGFSAMMSANGIGAAIAGLVLAWAGSRLSRRVAIYGGSALFCISLLFLAAAQPFWLMLLLLAVSGFAMILFGISSQTKIQEEVPDALRGRVMAVYSLVFNGLFSVGGLEIGYLAGRLKPMGAVHLNAAVCLVLTIAILAWSLVDKHRLEAEEIATGDILAQ